MICFLFLALWFSLVGYERMVIGVSLDETADHSDVFDQGIEQDGPPGGKTAQGENVELGGGPIDEMAPSLLWYGGDLAIGLNSKGWLAQGMPRQPETFVQNYHHQVQLLLPTGSEVRMHPFDNDRVRLNRGTIPGRIAWGGVVEGLVHVAYRSLKRDANCPDWLM